MSKSNQSVHGFWIRTVIPRIFSRFNNSQINDYYTDGWRNYTHSCATFVFVCFTDKDKKRKGKSPKSDPSKQFSPTPGRSGISHHNGPVVNNSNHRESSIHLPLKEYEVPDFLKDTQLQRRQENTSPVVKRNLKDPDFSSRDGPGLMIPREELAVPEFLRSNEDRQGNERSRNGGNSTVNHKSTGAQANARAENRGRADRVDRQRPSKPADDRTVRIESNGVRDYGKMNGEQRPREHSRDRKQEHEVRGNLRKQQQNSQMVDFQKKLNRASTDLTEKVTLPGKDTRFSSKTSSDTDSDFKVQQRIVFADNGEEAGTYDEFSLKRKYKKGAVNKSKSKGQPGGSMDLIEKVGTPTRTQLEPGGRRKSHNWPTDTDSVQSTSSQSFTEPISTMSSDKDKFSVSVRDHGNLALRGITPNGILSSAGKLHLAGSSNGHVEDDVDSPPSTQRSSNLNAGLGYYESSPEEEAHSHRVKRKDSLQAHLRNRITKLEKVKQPLPRSRYDSDSTTISDHSAFEEVLPNYSRRRSGTRHHSLNDLPEDILIYILSYLSTKDLCKASGVCQKWQTLCWDPVLWSNINIANYQDSDISKVLRNLLAKLAMDTQGYCITVHSIKLSGCELLSDKGLGFIARFCVDLEDLDVSGCCCITSKGLHDILLNCHTLTHLDTSGCTCVNSISAPVANGFGLGHHGSFLQLRHLDLSDCVAFDDLGLRVVGLSCGLLESLYLRRCNRITDVSIKHIAQHCVHLKELSVSDCYKVRDFSLKEIAKNSASLKYLSVAKCPVTDTGMKYIGKHCVKLKYLNIRGCESVTDVGITHIVQNCLKLRSLDVGKCDITDNGLHIIGIHCPQLKKLSVRGCDRVTDTGVKTIAAQCCSVQYLNLQECSLSYETFMYIREHCKNCVIEHTCPAFF